MRGNNVLQLNHASMLEAMQLYTGHLFGAGSPLAVTDVRYNEETGLFNVVLTEKEDPNQLALPLRSPWRESLDAVKA